jgi:hypothetical protein
VSAVNGQFYHGGEFTPDHGKYCGRGKNRVTESQFAAVAAKVAAAGKVLEVSEQTGEFVVKSLTGNGLFRAASLKTIAKCF